MDFSIANANTHLKIISRTSTTVFPASPSNNQVIYLNSCDLFSGRRRYVPILALYRADQASSGTELLPTKILVESLSKLLVHFYPVAGRLRRRPDDKLEIVCNDAGVEFVEAFTDGKLSDIGDFGLMKKEMTEFLDPTGGRVCWEPLSELPLLFVQVTRFSCGGAAFLWNMNHIVADGASAGHFSSSWSEIARGKELSLHPLHDRTLIKSKVPSDPNFHPPELRIAMKHPVKRVERMFTFSTAQIRSKLETDGASLGFRCSTFVILCAHVWRAITKARGLDPSAISKLLTTMDVRKRMNPNLPDGFFGNAVCYVHASATVHEIVHDPLSSTASRIHKAISEFSDEYMQLVLGWMDQQKQPLDQNVNAGQDIKITNWGRLRFDDLDFGSGKPDFVRPGIHPPDESVYLLPSHKGPGFISVHVSLRPETMEVLESDLKFIP